MLSVVINSQDLELVFRNGSQFIGLWKSSFLSRCFMGTLVIILLILSFSYKFWSTLPKGCEVMPVELSDLPFSWRQLPLQQFWTLMPVPC